MRRRTFIGDTTPPIVVAFAIIAAALLITPLIALLLDAPWLDLTRIFSSPIAQEALRLTLIASILATALSFALGVPLAWLLARDVLPLTRLWRALVIVPLLLPPVVSGVALLSAFGRRGLVGGWLYDSTGFQLPFHTAGVVVAATFVAMPFLIITVEGAFRSVDREIEEAAAVDGATSTRVLRSITLPAIAPALLAGTVLAWARAVGEFGATITFAGNLEGATQTMPLAIYTAMESDRDTAIAMSIMLLVVAVAILVTLRGYYLPGRARRT